MYLRKSRKDRDLELQTGNFDTLQRHRDALLALAKQRGYSIVHIYEEVVSGDSIAERPEMRKLLSAVETGAFAGVLVMEVPRLARGNTKDQGIVAETFQYSGTKIITPDKIYDPADEADEEYFEFGLFMSRREYKAINRRLQRGRMASLEEGKYIGGTPPYGYRKVKLPRQKGYTLEVDPDAASVVREIFHLYTVGDSLPDGRTEPIGSYHIANLLNARGILSPGGVRWSASGVRDILKNPVYAGYVRWAYRPNRKQMVDGVLTVTTSVNKDSVLKKGIHESIIGEDTWRAAQAAMTGRGHAPMPGNKRTANPLAGLVYCSVCGRSLVQMPATSRGAPRLMCPTPKCPTVSSLRYDVEAALLEALRGLMESYLIRAEENAAQQEEGDSAIKEAQQRLAKAQNHLDGLQRQRGSLFDLLEQGTYTQEIFLERSRVLAGRIAEAEQQISTLQEHLAALEESENTRKNLVPQLQTLLEVYDTLDTAEEKNKLLKSILDHAIYTKSAGGRWGKSDMQLFIFPKLE